MVDDAINEGSTCFVGVCDDPEISKSMIEIRSLVSKVCAVWRTVLLHDKTGLCLSSKN